MKGIETLELSHNPFPELLSSLLRDEMKGIETVGPKL